MHRQLQLPASYPRIVPVVHGISPSKVLQPRLCHAEGPDTEQQSSSVSLGPHVEVEQCQRQMYSEFSIFAPERSAAWLGAHLPVVDLANARKIVRCVSGAIPNFKGHPLVPRPRPPQRPLLLRLIGARYHRGLILDLRQLSSVAAVLRIWF